MLTVLTCSRRSSSVDRRRRRRRRRCRRSIYTSDEFLAFEREAVFAQEWLCVGRAEPDPERRRLVHVTVVNDEPIIVARAKDGSVRALSAVCQHRGMQVADGDGNCTKFTCPYHHWSYGLDGRLLGAPGDGAHASTSTRRTIRCRPDGRAVAGLRVRELRPRRGAARADARHATSRSSSNYDLDERRVSAARSRSTTCRGTGR